MRSCSRPRPVEGERSSSRTLVYTLQRASRVHNYVGVVVTCSTLTRVSVDVRTRPLCARKSSSSISRYAVAPLRHDAGAVWVRKVYSGWRQHWRFEQWLVSVYSARVITAGILAARTFSAEEKAVKCELGERREWLQYNDMESVMFCSMCILLL